MGGGCAGHKRRRTADQPAWWKGRELGGAAICVVCRKGGETVGCQVCGRRFHRGCAADQLQRGFTASSFTCWECWVWEMRRLGSTSIDLEGQGLFEEGLRLEALALAEGTEGNYVGNRKRLEKFVEEELKMPVQVAFPSEKGRGMPWQVWYLWVVAAAGRLAFGTMRNYEKAVNEWHASKGERELSPTKHFRVVRLWKGIEKRYGAEKGTPKRKYPLTMAMLRVIILYLQRAALKAEGRERLRLQKAACWVLVGWMGLLRRSELASLRLSDLQVTEDHLVIKVRSSKTDQAGRGQEVLCGWPEGIVRHKDGARGIIKAYLEELKRAGLGGADPLFGLEEDPRKAYKCKGEGLVKLFQRTCKEASRVWGLGWEKLDLAGHSLRRGGAQALRDAGVPRHLIKAHGRWASEAVDVYLDVIPRDWRCSVTRRLKKASWRPP